MTIFRRWLIRILFGRDVLRELSEVKSFVNDIALKLTKVTDEMRSNTEGQYKFVSVTSNAILSQQEIIDSLNTTQEAIVKTVNSHHEIIKEILETCAKRETNFQPKKLN